ncbi:MAG: hypothetical protein U0X73_04555 [Thermoanaerobaculia bacterium]
MRESDSGWMGLSPQQSMVWGTSVHVAGSRALRLHLEDLRLPAGARLWVYPPFGEARPVSLRHASASGGLWTPVIEGDTVHFELELPPAASGGVWGLRIAELADLAAYIVPDASATPQASPEDCLVFGSCVTSGTFPAKAIAELAVFQYFFEEQGSSFTCSGGLLNDRVGDFTPYGLTANHCVHTQEVADTVDPAYKFRWNSCPPSTINDYSYSLSSVGSLLVATKAIPGPDVTLLLMNPDFLPGGLGFLGWTTDPSVITDGDQLYRLSHPVAGVPGLGGSDEILAQMFSRQTVDTTPDFACGDGDSVIEEGEIPFQNFIYSVMNFGTTVGGSSGSPVMTADGLTVGQLLGTCSISADSCVPSSFNELDGWLGASFQYIGPFIYAPGDPCIPGDATACLLGGRFQVEVSWATTSDTGVGRVMSFDSPDFFPGRASSDQASFWWFFNAANFEMGVKMVDACVPPFNSFWVFVSGLTNQGYTVTITDLVNHNVRHFTNPLGTYPTTIGATNTIQGFPCN